MKRGLILSLLICLGYSLGTIGSVSADENLRLAANLETQNNADDDQQTIQLPQPLKDDDYHEVSLEAARLGQLLFYDKILSGNQNIACSTCHHHDLASADGLSLGIGEGGIGLGTERTVGIGPSKVKRRVPRNASALFNLGAKEFTHLFHDGRVSIDPIFPSGFNTPAEEFLPKGLNNLLAAQALFPVTSPVEMAGERNENQIAGATRRRPDYVWAILLKRLQAIAAYEPLFKAAYPEIKASPDITIVHVGNALADFMAHEWRSDESPFDHYLRGDPSALSDKQKQGMELFYGKANCSSCHSGALQTDHGFHALMLPGFGPGRTRRFEFIARDQGRINETDRLEDAYRFRTPSLRNVTATAPYGHNGAYATLEGIIRHHLNPVESLAQYQADQLVMPKDPYLVKTDFIIQQDKREMARLKRQNDINLPPLSDSEIDLLIEFLGALTDQKALYGRLKAPAEVPSGIAVD
ncbi:cytochrome-c peroxidase [Leucothrix pacifica]|uniref:Methylamine utilization protein MauG n=1 Tax=Leucothrix pacifica TaxID=1247513 RepID=A0A317C7N9_9GAMM|nr:cytochrome c peroxidase [Leucothrix pacifica]PWQ94317.1 methylamine utilization protein MauG [Leucothrix pacifica]